jgi:tRNA(Ser,Leu) C12 N-acetylase TAN1
MSNHDKKNPRPSASKRKYLSRSFNTTKNPKRGGPGILLTCETGREGKCRQEAIDIVNHYHDQMSGNTAAVDTTITESSKNTLSLDEEIQQIHRESQKTRANHIFSVYETGVRGTVTVLCTLPEAMQISILPSYQRGESKSFEVSEKLEDDENQPDSKRPKIESQVDNVVNGNTPHAVSCDAASKPSWDPIHTVRQIINDIRKKNDAPSSRFITRMIPLQATCCTTEIEITHVANELFSRMNGSTSADSKDSNIPTFAIHVKRRTCSHLRSATVIDWIAKVAPSHWKVDLSNPQYTIMVEICKTLCGIAIIENVKDYSNFNIMEIKDKTDGSKL